MSKAKKKTAKAAKPANTEGDLTRAEKRDQLRPASGDQILLLLTRQTELLEIIAHSCARLMQIGDKQNRLSGEAHRVPDVLGLKPAVEKALTREAMLRTLITNHDGSAHDEENSSAVQPASRNN